MIRILLALVVLLLADAASAKTVHIVAFGDSATYGYLVARREAYPAQLQAALRKKGHDVVVENAGLNGDTLAHAMRRLDQAIGPGTDIVLVEFGTNDRRAGASMAAVRERLSALIRVLKARRIEVMVIGLGSLDLADVAKANGVGYAQFKLPPHKYRARDGAHFNAEGNAILVKRLLPQVEALIARRR